MATQRMNDLLSLIVAAIITTLLAVPASVYASADITLSGLFKNKAVLQVDGKQKLVKVGDQVTEDIKLVAIRDNKAILRVNGKQVTVGLSERIASSFSVVERHSVPIRRDASGQYEVRGTINGRTATFLVDTGANIIAMNSSQARRLGINYEAGQPSQVTTASGVTGAYSIVLDKVDVGGLVVRNVRASVIEGNYPVTILLGMTYLSRVTMRENNGILYLESKL